VPSMDFRRRLGTSPAPGITRLASTMSGAMPSMTISRRSRTPGSPLADSLRDLADWLCRQLEQAHGFMTSDKAVDEAIHANDYRFTAEGRRFG
jgi:hypothetical protein